MIWFGLVNKARWLRHKHFLSERSINEHIIDIKLINRSTMRQGNCENNPYSCGFYDWAKIFVVVNAGVLVKAFGDKTSFIAVNRRIRVPFYPKNPLTTNMILRRMSWN